MWRLLASGHQVTNMDYLTYAATDPEIKSDDYRFVYGDVTDPSAVTRGFAAAERKFSGVDVVVHMAAETHVDRSLEDPARFVRTNVLGTQVVLQAALRAKAKFVYISTDEVYGDVIGRFSEEGDPIKPSSPYSASKAGGECLARAYERTYGLPVVVVRPSNNYGPYQFPEKFIPVVIRNALANEPIPLYGRGENSRDWLYVEDCAEAIEALVGAPSGTYNVSTGRQVDNAQVVQKILGLLGKPASMVLHVADRPGHDVRYAPDPTHVRGVLGWAAKTGFDEGLSRTVRWYRDNAKWTGAALEKAAGFEARNYENRDEFVRRLGGRDD